MNSSRQDEVILNENGEKQNPINVDIVSVIIKCLCCSIGIPLNASIAVTITRLHRRPRNHFLLGIILSHLSFFIPTSIELIYWAYSVEYVCDAYMAVAVIPQGLLLTNMLLALIDRYLAINHPLLHRRKMTTRFAGCLIITCSVFIVFLIKFVYIVQLRTLGCETLLLHLKMNAVILVVLFISCIVLNIIIYRQTRTLLRESRTLQATQEESDPSNGGANVNDDTAFTPMCIHVDREKLGDMEMEATRTLVIGVASLCVMPCLALIFKASFFACRLVYGQSACTNLLKIAPIIKEFSLSLAIYGPIIFLVRNRELRVACACKVYR